MGLQLVQMCQGIVMMLIRVSPVITCLPVKRSRKAVILAALAVHNKPSPTKNLIS